MPRLVNSSGFTLDYPFYVYKDIRRYCEYKFETFNHLTIFLISAISLLMELLIDLIMLGVIAFFLVLGSIVVLWVFGFIVYIWNLFHSPPLQDPS